ncbi:non-muscle cofilin 1-like [Anarrhichthys ocellatus]|uniref:non-muscle cofilin 1-like n=1 Tax=Anarrhichthys ocellatus TaxID=433405 RepID=UPI0012ED5B53|nr:cofilin-2-like [Anarrhichthys ocellatus]
MSSGVKVCDEVKTIFNKMKVVKTEDAEEDRIRLVTCVIDEEKGEIKVETCLQQKSEECKDDVFKSLQNLMPKDHCRYILYDCHFETEECCKKEELVFMLWTPDSATIKEKMQYASSKGAIDKVMEGVKHRMQLHDKADIDREEFAKCLTDKVKNLEGHSMRGHAQ